MKLKESPSVFKTIAKNTAISFFSKILTYINYVIVAYIFGAQLSTDIYYLGTSFVSSCTGVFIIVISSVFSPILIRLRIKSSMQEAREFAGSFFSITMCILGIGCLVFALFPVQIFSMVSKFSVENLHKNHLILVIFSLIIFFTVVAEFGKVYIQSFAFFSIVAYTTLVQAVIFVGLILALAGVFKILALVIGLLVSLILQIMLLYLFCRKHKIVPLLNLSPNKLHKELFTTSAPLLVAHAITLAVAYLMDYLASGMEAGSLTSITFALRLYAFPMMLFFNPMLEVINTKFSEYYHNDPKALAEKYVLLQRFFIVTLVPVMSFFIFFKLEIVKLFFMRGAFGLKEAIVTANSLGIYATTIVTFSLLSVITRVYFVMQKTGTSSLYGSISQVLVLMVAFTLSHSMGYIAIPIAKVAIEFLFLLPISFWLVNKYLPHNGLQEVVFPLLGLSALGIGLGFLFYSLFAFSSNYFITGHEANQKLIVLVDLAFNTLLFTGTYFIIIYKAKLKEAFFIIEKLLAVKKTVNSFLVKTKTVQPS